MMPSSRARTNTPIACPANSSSARSVITTVRLVVIDRPNVWRIEWLTIRANDSPAWRLRFSRTRSNTTIVSWTEKPMTVRIAVTNRLSIWTPKNVPRSAKAPTTTMTSWTSATSAVTPIFTSRKRYVIQSTIPSDPNRISVSAWTTRSLDTTAPTVDSERCSVIDPSWSSSATRISPSLPSVGSAPPTEGDADGDGAALAPGDADAPAAALALGEGDADGDALAPGEADAPADTDAEGTGVGVGDGIAGRSRVSLVRISMNPSPPSVTWVSTP